MNDMTQDEQTQLIELSMESAKEQIAMVDALNRLRKHKDFKRVITDCFMGSECTRLVKALADPACQSSGSQAALHNRIIAIGILEQFFIAVSNVGEQARKALNDYEQDLQEVLNEEA